MTGAPLVDLLLVRLTRDEEKEKVREFLVSELGMTEEAAMKAAESTPCMLDIPVPMDEARRIQEMIYPFIDLLPRHYGTSQEEPSTPPEVTGDREIIFDDVDADSGLFDGPAAPTASEADDDEPLIITTAAEEVQSIERCHICGRTPTDFEKLAPCRTCGAPTCGDCFDRIVHVCEKCASEGRIVDRPLKGAPEYRRDQTVELEEDLAPAVERQPFRIPPALLVVGVLAVLAAVFILLDPLGLMGGDDGTEPQFGGVGPDTTLALTSPDSIAPDTTQVLTPDSFEVAGVDTLGSGAVLPDSSSSVEVDTSLAMTDSLVDTSIPDSLLIPLRDIQLPEGIEPPDEMTSPRLLFSSPVQGIEVLTDSLPHLSYPMGILAANYDMETDGISLVRTESGSEVLLVSIMHPVPLEHRVAFISDLCGLLDSTSVDQMVFYYLQSSYHPFEMLTFVSDSFSVVSSSRSPIFVQNRQAYAEESWEILSGPVREWMLGLD